MRIGVDGQFSEEAANYHTASQALPRSLEQCSFRTRKRVVALLRCRDPCPEGLQNLMLVLGDGEMDAKMTAECLQKVSEWLRRSSGITQSLMVKFRTHGAIINAVRCHGMDIDVARAGCGVISGAVLQSTENSVALTRGGVILQVYMMMDGHPYDRIVQDNACVALWRLGERGGARQITLTGGVQRLLRAMRDNPRNPFVQSAGCGGLHILLELGGSTEYVLEMREAANVALRNHKGNVPIRRNTDKLLRWCELILKKGPVRSSRVKVVRPTTQVKLEQQTTVGPLFRAPQISLKDWLTEVDTEQELLMYHRTLSQNFDSVTHIVDSYTSTDGELTADFFEEVGIENDAHAALFRQWFRELMARQEKMKAEEVSPYLPGELAPWEATPMDELLEQGTGLALATESYGQEGEEDFREEEGEAAWPKGWQRALTLLDRVNLREALWERALEHLDKLRRGGVRCVEGLSSSSDDDDGSEEACTRATEQESRLIYNAALKTCEEGWKWEQAVTLLSDMDRQGVLPDGIGYAAALGACSAERQWGHALRLLDRMHEEGRHVKTVTYNAAIWSLEDEDSPWERAISVLADMRCHGVATEPSPLTYTAAISVLRAHGQWESALALLSNMSARRVRPDIGTHRAIKDEDWGVDWPVERAVDLLDRMVRR
eukprot:NODE_2932_length_2119_cov_10.913655.p1 GENE.NODE_2932_length_2119_cov_10.913655~~NODE_2932_length_2119_cov_10.913655.p1  ORF type:complete len:661 (+),score=150.02 NODE_2932_length_2119_cov_10.913655:78-2060(+)